MRRFSFFIGLAGILVLAGSMTAAAQQGVSNTERVTPHSNGNACADDRLLQSAEVKGNAATTGLNPERFSILNWNIYKGQRENWASDFQRYTYKHDLVTIQEAHLDDELEAMLDSEHQYWTLNTAFHYGGSATGVMTASRVKPLGNCGQRTVEPLIRFAKTSLISYYPIEGMTRNLLVANIHGIIFTLGVDVYTRQLEKLYEVMKLHDGPIILAGDFNTWSDSRMRIVENFADMLALKSLDYTNHNRTSAFGNALDHVFYRGLDPVEHDTWHVTSSDHNPTRVSFRVNKAAPASQELAAREFDDDNC